MHMTATHPEPLLLIEFSLGKLSDADAKSIEQHLGQCDSCCQQLEEMAADDSFAALIRGCDPDVELLAPTAASTAAITDVSFRSSLDVQEQMRKIAASLANHPRYAVRELVGIGGMGAVYRASHRLMNREVAVKVIRPEILNRAGAAKRFHREVQAAARLAHPNIVTAYDAEQFENQHLLVMEFVEGRNLAEVVQQRGPLSMIDACDYIRQAALGLQHAHEQGMVHRDIKPHNLMLTSDDQVKILDFGLASLVADDVIDELADEYTDTASTSAFLTKASTMIGTPDYIAPEQVADARSADIRADIYGLGCTLYFLLSGRPPFTDGSAMDRIHAHCQRQPQSIGELRKNIPAKLAVVLEKMMAKEPDQRYQTPAELVAVLTPLIADVDALAAPTRQLKAERSRFRFGLRTLVLALLPIFLATAGGLIYIQNGNGTIAIATDDPDVRVIVQQNGEQVTILDQTTNQQVTLDTASYSVRLGGDASGLKMNLPEGEPFQLRRGQRKVVTITRTVPKINSPAIASAAGIEDATGHPTFQSLSQFAGHVSKIADVALLTDGLAASVGADRQVRIWNLATGGQVRSFGVLTGANGKFSPDGRFVAVGESEEEKLPHLRDVQLSSVETGKPLWTSTVATKKVQGFQFLPDYVVVLAGGGPTVLLDGRTGTLIRELLPTGWVDFAAAVSPDNSLIFLRKAGSSGLVLRVADASPVVEMSYPEKALMTSAVWSADSKTIATGDLDGTIHVWDAVSGEQIHQWAGDTRLISTLLFTADLQLISGGAHQVAIWRYPTGELLASQSTPKYEGLYLSLNRKTNRLLSGGGWWWDGTFHDSREYAVHYWQLRDYDHELVGRQLPEFPLVRKLEGNTAAVHGLAYLHDGERAVATSASGHVGMWDVATGDTRWTFDARPSKLGARGVAVSPNGKTIAFGDGSGLVYLLDAGTGRELKRWQARDDGIPALAFSPAGDRLAVVGWGESRLHVWNTADGSAVELAHDAKASMTIAWSPDGKEIAAGGAMLYRYEASSGRLLEETRFKQGVVHSVEFSADGKMLACGLPNGTIVLVDRASSAQRLLAGHTEPVDDLAFTPDGSRLLSTARDRTLRLWEVKSGTEIARQPATHHIFHCLALAPDGKTVLTGGGWTWDEETRQDVADGDYAIRLWRLP